MLSLAKIKKLAAAGRFESLLDEVCRNGRPRIGPSPTIAPTRAYASTPGALPLMALGLGLRRAVELSWTVEPGMVDIADAIATRICQLAALRCRSGKVAPLPEFLNDALAQALLSVAQLLKHCEETHNEIDPAAQKRLTAALEIGRFLAPAERAQTGRAGAAGESATVAPPVIFMSAERAAQLSRPRREDDDQTLAA